MTRGEMHAELKRIAQSTGLPQWRILVDRYLQGHARFERQQETNR